MGRLLNLIPNIKQFFVRFIGFDPILKLYGLNKVLRKNSSIEYSKRLRKCNKYLRKQYSRLNKLSEKREIGRFWKVAWLIIRQSKAYRMACFDFVLHNWHRKHSISTNMLIWKKISNLLNNRNYHVDFKRTFIPKAEAGKFRPLGVPTKAWRVYARMLYIPLQIFLKPTQVFNQHGARPGRGTYTAWLHLLKYIIKSRNIYEFDLLGFFDNVRDDIIHSTMIFDYGMNPQSVQWWIRLIRSLPKINPKFMARELGRTTLTTYRVGNIEYFPRVTMSAQHGMSLAGMRTNFGVPQGLNISPTLATLILEPILRKLKFVQMYMDDGLIFGNDKMIDSRIKQFKEECRNKYVFMNENKSGFVKYLGEWIKPLKYLGMSLDKEGLRAATRSGKTQLIKWELLERSLKGGKLEFEGFEYTIEEFLKHNSYYHKYLPFLMAKVWGVEEYEDDEIISKWYNTYSIIWEITNDDKLVKQYGLPNIMNASSIASEFWMNLIKKR